MAALAQDYRKPEPFEVPEGGLASFLTATTGEWAEASNDDYIPETGIAGVKAVANKLAEYGRYEDEYMVHAAEGETVIPAQVLDLNPRLKAKLFKEMRDMGLDPERYVVGNELNSLNPVTGQPEFFLKKLFKGIKKAVKKVVKVLKKASTVVLPIVGGMLGGPLGAALGSGIATAIQGGNLKDVLKSAAISGLTAGVFQAGQAGFQAASAGSATGFGNVGEFLSGAGQSVSSGLSGGYADQFGQMVSSLSGGASTAQQPIEFGPAEGMPTTGQELGAALPPGTEQIASSTGIEFGPAGGMPTTGQELGAALPPGTEQIASSTGIEFGPAGGTPTTGQELTLNPPTTTAQAGNLYTADTGFGAGGIEQAGFFESMGQGFSNLSQGNFGQFLNNMKQAFLPENFTADNVREAFKNQFGEQALANSQIDFTKLASDLASSEAAPNIFRRYLPMIGLTTGALAATGGFEAPEMEPLPDPYGGVTGMDLLAENRGLYAPGVFDPRSLRTAAGGGDITHFPRRDGAIYGPGTETSDDIPAMLSDGEFVMTARAVRGAGNGDREQGMQRMYDIMRRFEGGAIRGN